MKHTPSRVLVTTTALAMAATGCSSSVGGGSGSGDSSTFTIGYVSPQTGALADFGESDSYTIDQMRTYFASHPLKVKGKKLKVKIVVKDAQSDSTRAGAVTADLINNDNADLILASSTPDIVNPASEQCEANSVPCITTVAPWQTVAFRNGGTKPADLKYTYNFFWGLEDVAAIDADEWSQVKTNKKVGGIFPNDPDGQAWSANFPSLVKSGGYSIENPGLYPNGTKDFSAQISKLKGTDILVGVPIPPDFTTFWKQAYQQGYRPKIATVGKALLFPSVVASLGSIANNLGTEVWWHPTAPFSNSLTGQSSKQLAASYEQKTGRQWTQPLGYSQALFEIAVAAVEKADSTDAGDLVKTLKHLSVDTVVGPVAWGKDPDVPPYVAKTQLTGGQWRKSSGKYPFELTIVDNKLAPEIPTGGKVEPLNP